MIRMHGRHLPPRTQRAQLAITRGVLGSTMEDPALRLVSTGGRRTYTGGDLVVQRFLRATGPNDDASLELAPVQINRRRALGNRGYVSDLVP